MLVQLTFCLFLLSQNSDEKIGASFSFMTVSLGYKLHYITAVLN